MARRRSAEVDGPGAEGRLPDRLRDCIIEDWIDVDHVPQRSDSIRDEAGVIHYLEIHAWGLWRRERRVWVAQQGLEWREWSHGYPMSRPYFRGDGRPLIDAIGPRLIRESAP